jgi:hypothetical protein
MGYKTYVIRGVLLLCYFTTRQANGLENGYDIAAIFHLKCLLRPACSSTAATTLAIAAGCCQLSQARHPSPLRHSTYKLFYKPIFLSSNLEPWQDNDNCKIRNNPLLTPLASTTHQLYQHLPQAVTSSSSWWPIRPTARL